MKKNILLAGGSGLVGGFALAQLLDDARIEKIILVARRPQHIINPKIVEVIGELDQLERIDLRAIGISHIDAAICSLGSTIKKAGTQEAFRKVDCSLVLSVADFSKRFGAKKFAVVSALGADKNSPIFYNRVKGEMEEGLKSKHFSSLTIVRPSLILGERKEKRIGEEFLIRLSPLINKTLIGPLKKYRGIEAHKVAHHLMSSIFSSEQGLVIIENDQMLDI